MLKTLESNATSVAQPSATARSAFKQWPNNRIATDQQEASNKLLLHLRDEGLSQRLIGKELGISKRSVIKRLKKLGISGPSEFAIKQQEQRALEKCLKSEEAKLFLMSPQNREKYIMLRSEVIRLKMEENSKHSAIAIDLKISESMVSKILINAGFRTRKVREKALSKEMHDKIVRMCKNKSRSAVARSLSLEKSTVYKHSPVKTDSQKATKSGEQPIRAIKAGTNSITTPMSWNGIPLRTDNRVSASQLRAA